MRTALKEKFTEYQIPVNIVNSFLAKYRLFERGVFPEIELRAVPSDDSFKTLQTYCNSLKVDYAIARIKSGE